MQNGRGPQVPQRRDFRLGNWLANHSICSPGAIYLVRECPPQTMLSGMSGLESSFACRYGHLLGAGVGYLGLGCLTARFSETSTKPFASNIKANLTLVTFTKYSFI